jgi:hypothetical protein
VISSLLSDVLMILVGVFICMQFFDRPSSVDGKAPDDRTATSGASEHSEESEEDESDESEDEKEVVKRVAPQVASTDEGKTSRGGGIDELLAAEIDEIRTKKKVLLLNPLSAHCNRVFSKISGTFREFHVEIRVIIPPHDTQGSLRMITVTMWKSPHESSRGFSF